MDLGIAMPGRAFTVLGTDLSLCWASRRNLGVLKANGTISGPGPDLQLDASTKCHSSTSPRNFVASLWDYDGLTLLLGFARNLDTGFIKKNFIYFL